MSGRTGQYALIGIVSMNAVRSSQLVVTSVQMMRFMTASNSSPPLNSSKSQSTTHMFGSQAVNKFAHSIEQCVNA